MMNRFEDQVVIVTGGTAGIGKAYVKALTDEGATVIMVARNKETGTAVEEEFRREGRKVDFFQCDVSNEEDVKRVADQTYEKYGRIDVLINNAHAGKDAMGPLTETTAEAMNLNWDSGVMGTFFFMKYTIPYMKQRGYGRIINTGSNAGVKGMPNFCAYAASKEAIRGLTRAAANEYGEYGITCNVICPSALTEEARKWAETYPDRAEEALKNQPIKHLGEPEKDVTPIVMFLASAESQFVTGQTIGVDGGKTVMP